jgi:hypothetical protein
VASQPELLADHLAAYGELAAVQVQAAAGQLQQRAVLVAVATLSAALGIGLVGVALLLLGALPLQAMPAPWLLALVPLVPLVVAAGCVLRLRGLKAFSALTPLRDQLAADAALLREASRP